jgi:hypothetical protein
MRTLFIPLILAAATASPASAAAFRQEFPYPKAAVYEALVQTLPAEGFKIKDQDAVIARVTASAGMSGFSYGENMSMAVVENGDDKSTLEFDGKLKMGTNGLFAGGKNMKNFNKIVLAVSRRLQGK